VATLHIEHAITDLKTWLSAFGAFADARRQAGVHAERIQQPIDDDNYVVLDLDFGSADQAADFLHFLENQVWAVPDNAPALAGTPRTMILRPVTS
jgi:hypothetical protein